MLFLVLSFFCAEPAPVDMPRAEAYLVEDEGGVRRLEDRYDRMDLWYSHAVMGRWFDEDGRSFVLARLDVEPPSVGSHGTVTRRKYADECVPMKRVRANADIPKAFRAAIECLSPVPLAEVPRPPRQLPRGYRDVAYWQTPTNRTAIVCAFRPEKSEKWYLAAWELAEGDDFAERMGLFEDQFLRTEFDRLLERLKAEPPVKGAGERELLRADARQSVAAYPKWHFSSSPEFVVVDDLPTRGFVETLTNDVVSMRAKYAAALQTGIDGSNVLAVARIYASRDEYLDALEQDGNTNMEWTAAYWSPERRELVAHLTEGDAAELLRTFRHESFHQYLSYASSMISVSPWLNEGYAQYFEDTESRDWKLEVTPEALDLVAHSLPGVLMMDYEQFYAGTDMERRTKYRIAWSIAVFLEKGAAKVRFQPFKDLKRRYFEELFNSKDMRRATSAAFENEDRLRLFVSEWKKFWVEE